MTAIINTIVQMIGFFNFTFSDFLLPCNRSISLHLFTIMVLNIITIRYIMLKYNKAFKAAEDENVNWNFVKSASNILATRILISCDKTIPRARPTPKEITPIIRVSKKRIRDIFLLDIPKVK